MVNKMEEWDRVLEARKPERPKAIDYINYIFTDFTDMHGDRYFGDDKAIVGGIAFFNNIPVTVIGNKKENLQKKTCKEILECQIQKDIEKH